MDEMTAEQNTEQVTKDEIWENLKANLEALEKPRNLLLLGSLGTGKSSFINTVITALTGKYKYYADVGRGSSHNTMRLHMIPSAEYWNPENKEIKAQNLPTFIDIIGLETSLSESKEEISVNKELMRLIINGQLPQNCDLFDLSNKLKNREKINIKPDLQIAAVDIIIVVLSAENYVTPDILLYDICKEAKFETKNIPVFLVLTNVDKSNLSEKGLEEKKNDICSIMNIEPYKVLMCSNYQPDHKPSIKKDIKILEFLMKLSDPCFKAVTLQKMESEKPALSIEIMESEKPAPSVQEMECEIPAPLKPHASTPCQNADDPSVMTGAFICLLLAFLIGLILHFGSKI
eukprot:XP_011443834.1 PREDICTED: uncharacterized protein LOC105339805 [Crassostrea gigas]